MPARFMMRQHNGQPKVWDMKEKRFVTPAFGDKPSAIRDAKRRNLRAKGQERTGRK